MSDLDTNDLSPAENLPNLRKKLKKRRKKAHAHACSCQKAIEFAQAVKAAIAAPKAPSAPKGQELVKHQHTGKLVSKKNKTGRTECSQAMSDWKRGHPTPQTFTTLAKCRAIAAGYRRAQGHREAGREAMAQSLEKRFSGQHVTVKERSARAQELRAARNGLPLVSRKYNKDAIRRNPSGEIRNYIEKESNNVLQSRMQHNANLTPTGQVKKGREKREANDRATVQNIQGRLQNAINAAKKHGVDVPHVPPIALAPPNELRAQRASGKQAPKKELPPATERGVNAEFKKYATPEDVRAAAALRAAGRKASARLRISQGSARVGDYVRGTQEHYHGQNQWTTNRVEGRVVGRGGEGKYNSSVLILERGDGQRSILMDHAAKPLEMRNATERKPRYTPDRLARAAELRAQRAAKQATQTVTVKQGGTVATQAARPTTGTRGPLPKSSKPLAVSATSTTPRVMAKPQSATPSLKEQAAKHRAKKGTKVERLSAMIRDALNIAERASMRSKELGNTKEQKDAFRIVMGGAQMRSDHYAGSSMRHKGVSKAARKQAEKILESITAETTRLGNRTKSAYGRMYSLASSLAEAEKTSGQRLTRREKDEASRKYREINKRNMKRSTTLGNIKVQYEQQP